MDAITSGGRAMFRRATLLLVLLIASPLQAGQPAAADISDCWRMLADADGEKAYRAMRRLAASPAEALGLLGKQLPAAAKTITPAGLDKLIRKLDSNSFAERDRAQQELMRLDWQALAALRKAMQGDGSLEWKRRVERLIAQLEGPLRGARLRDHRAVEVVEWIGNAEAKALLQRWAKGDPASRLAAQASRALKRLDEQPQRIAAPPTGWPKVDRFGDPLPPGVVLRLGSARWRIGETGGASFVRYTPDGKRLVVMTGHYLTIIDASTGKVLRRRQTHPDSRWDAQSGLLTSDGRRLVVASQAIQPMGTYTLQVWNVDDWKLIKEWPSAGTPLGFADNESSVLLDVPKGIRQVNLQTGRQTAFFPLPGKNSFVAGIHGKLVVVRPEGQFRVLLVKLTAPEKTVPLELPPRTGARMEISPDGKMLACSVGYGDVMLYDLDTGKPLRQIVPRKQQRGYVSLLAFSPDSKTFLFCAERGSVSELVAWDTSGQRLRWKAPSGTASAAFSPDGRFIAVNAGGGLISILAAATGKPVSADEPAMTNTTRTVAFSSDGRRLLTTTPALRQAAARLWTFPDGKLAGNFGHPSVFQAKLSPDNRWLATTQYMSDLRIWDTTSGRQIVTLPDDIRHSGTWRQLAFSADGRRLCTWESDFRVRTWDAATGRLLTDCVPHAQGFPRHLFADIDGTRRPVNIAPGSFNSSFRFFPDGSKFLWYYGKMRLYDTATGKELHSFKLGIEEDLPPEITISTDQEWLLVGGGSPRILIKLPDKKVTGLIHLDDASEAALAPDARSAALQQLTSKGARIILFELATLRPRLTIPLEYGRADGLAFSPDSRFLAVVHSDGTALVWDLHGVES